MNKTILQLAVPTPLRRYFDYYPPADYDVTKLQPGMRFKIPFGRRILTGLYIKTKTTSDVPKNKLKAAIECLDSEAILPIDLLELATQAANYYHYPIGEALLGILPVRLRQGKSLPEFNKTKEKVTEIIKEQPLKLNSAQKNALDKIIEKHNNFSILLLDGVTGSGKTEVYLQAISTILAENKQVLVMVPEISLTPQTINRFTARFNVPVVALNSGITPKSRLDAWLKAKNNYARILIGTRSTIFTPFSHLGLIIVDEEQDLSFKQQDGFHYHARDVAILRAKQLNIPIILGSATPSLETLHNVENKRYQKLSLPLRAGFASKPTFHLIDIRNRALENGLSPELLQTIKQHLENKNQVMLFLNRRGYAPVLLCHSCGWMAVCDRCDMRMTLHLKANYLKCHHCTKQTKIPTQCNNCGKNDFQPVGLGTEKLEETLSKYFPDFPIERIDRDSMNRKGKIEQAFARIHSGETKILLGTQMLSKGHHFPNVTLVAIINADGGFFSADFRSLERMGQQILQVAGRAGRAEKPGTVLIQTHHPGHPLLYQLLNDGYPAFAETILAERKNILLPPFSSYALFRAEANQIIKANDFLTSIRELIPQNSAIQVMGPIPASQPRRAGQHRAQLLLQTNNRPVLQNILKKFMPQIESLPNGKKVRWSLDVDPMEMS